MLNSSPRKHHNGFTLVELVIGFVVMGIIALTIFGLLSALVNSAAIGKQKAIASTLATNQMEYLKSLPYNNLAVQGGSIYTQNPIPNTSTSDINGQTYTIKTSINYIDDAYDGCTNYPSQALKEKYCRNYPSPANAPTTDTNPSDYKIANIKVYSQTNIKLAEIDTQIAARVAETASSTGALFITVTDDTGNPVSGSTVRVTNNTVSPAVDVSDATDSFGTAVLYGLPPDSTSYDYVINASKSGYSSLQTIAPSGLLQPNYPNQRVFTQQSSLITMVIKPMHQNSLIVETTNTSGSPIANARIYIKGGYKKYTDSADTSYYYDTLNPNDTRPQTNASGTATLQGLTPGDYFFCGDNQASSCTVGGTTYYLAALLPYGGNRPFGPLNIPTSSTATSFSDGTNNFAQKVRLMLTTSSSFPRINTIDPYEISKTSGPIANFSFDIQGHNLPCDSNPANCQTSVQIIDTNNVATATSCVGSSAGTVLTCTADISSLAIGAYMLRITSNGQTLSLPHGEFVGAINVTQ